MHSSQLESAEVPYAELANKPSEWLLSQAPHTLYAPNWHLLRSSVEAAYLDVRDGKNGGLWPIESLCAKLNLHNPQHSPLETSGLWACIYRTKQANCAVAFIYKSQSNSPESALACFYLKTTQ